MSKRKKKNPSRGGQRVSVAAIDELAQTVIPMQETMEELHVEFAQEDKLMGWSPTRLYLQVHDWKDYPHMAKPIAEPVIDVDRDREVDEV